MILTLNSELSDTIAAVLNVRSDGTSRTCDSWEDACGLQTALLTATDGDEIWVKAGIYKPAADTRFPEATFQLKEGVALYGGFTGTETAHDQRDWETHITVTGRLTNPNIRIQIFEAYTDSDRIVLDLYFTIELSDNPKEEFLHEVHFGCIHRTARLGPFVVFRTERKIF